MNPFVFWISCLALYGFLFLQIIIFYFHTNTKSESLYILIDVWQSYINLFSGQLYLFISFSIKQIINLGDEDCLYINVYVPREKPNPSDNFNVIAHFHGGAFMLGSGHMYAGPEYLMDEDVILVTMNYRVGALGMY